MRAKKLAEAEADAEYGLGLVVRVMQDSQQHMDLRVSCAKEVMDRVWGKPMQRQQVSGMDGGPIVIRVEYDDADSSLTASAS